MDKNTQSLFPPRSGELENDFFCSRRAGSSTFVTPADTLPASRSSAGVPTAQSSYPVYFEYACSCRLLPRDFGPSARRCRHRDYHINSENRSAAINQTFFVRFRNSANILHRASPAGLGRSWRNAGGRRRLRLFRGGLVRSEDSLARARASQRIRFPLFLVVHSNTRVPFVLSPPYISCFPVFSHHRAILSSRVHILAFYARQ